ncbi:MAG TPA: rod shape-determining protein RodA [Tissierellia bacterium]|nr:rod shape-determining protein RodA [Tissierellia bacterium]
MFKKESKLKRFDFILLLTTILLCVYGFIMINSATMSKPFGSEPFLKTQVTAFVLGMVALFILVIIDYDIYGNFYIPIYVLTNLLLLYTLINPVKATEWGDVRSWIAVGPVVFQPSELAKFGVIISVAKFIDINKENINEPAVLIKILLFAFLPVGLILLQPDLGTALVFIFFIGVMIYIGGIDRKYVVTVLILFLIFIIGGISIFFYIMNDYTHNENSPFEDLVTDYRFQRIITFFYPESDPDDTGYQVIQSKTAIGSGMVHGRGLYKGVQNQLGYLPTKETDFIFAVIGEELGLKGGILLLCLYAVLLYRLIRIAKNAANMFGSLIVTGITAMLLFHIYENIGMTMGLMPVTGIPLPFISYGGTFMLVNMISIGICLSVGMKKGKIDLNDF